MGPSHHKLVEQSKIVRTCDSWHGHRIRLQRFSDHELSLSNWHMLEPIGRLKWLRTSQLVPRAVLLKKPLNAALTRLESIDFVMVERILTRHPQPDPE